MYFIWNNRSAEEKNHLAPLLPIERNTYFFSVFQYIMRLIHFMLCNFVYVTHIHILHAEWMLIMFGEPATSDNTTTAKRILGNPDA